MYFTGRDGRAVQQQADIGEGEAEAAPGLGHAVNQPGGRVVGRGGRLEAMQRTGAAVEDLQVGEGAADVDADTDVHWFSSSLDGGRVSDKGGR